MVLIEMENFSWSILLKDFCESRAPAHLREKVYLDFEIKGQSVFIFEVRPKWDNPKEKIYSPIAKATFVKSKNTWKLYWMRADLKWHSYAPHQVCRRLEEVIKIIDVDESGCFWG